MTSDDISYLNGYLQVVATLNTFSDDGKDYTICLIDKDLDINISLQKFYNVTASRFVAKSMGSDWCSLLTEELKSYFCQVLTQKEINCVSEFKNNVETIHREFVVKMRELIKDVELFRIDVIWDVKQDGFFENYNNDYIFELADKYLYLHLGSSD